MTRSEGSIIQKNQDADRETRLAAASGAAAPPAQLLPHELLLRVQDVEQLVCVHLFRRCEEDDLQGEKEKSHLEIQFAFIKVAVACTAEFTS